MKKNFLWTMAALFVGGLALTSCDVSDNPNPNPVLPSDPEELFNKTSTVIDFEESTPFINDSRMATVGVDNVDGWESKVAIFKGAKNAQNGYSFAHYDFTANVQKAAISVVSFDMYNNQGSRSIVTVGDALVRTNGVGAGCAKMSYGAKGAIFRIGSDKNNAFINGKTYAQADLCNKWLKVEVKVYNFDRQVQWTVKEGDEIIAQSGVTEGEGEEAIFTPGKEDYWQADANEGTQIDVFGCINNSMNTYIDNLSITNAQDPSVKFADAKVIYVDPDGKEIKEAREVKEVRVGSTINLLESDKTPVYNAEKTVKWVYDTDNAAETPVAEEGTVVTVKFKDSGKYAWRLRQYFNDGQGANGTRIGTEWIEGEQFVGDTYQVFYQCAYKHPTDGKWYVAPIGSAGYQDRSYTFTGNESTNAAGTIHLMDVKYEKVDSIVWIGEFEDKTAMTLVGEVTTWIGWTDLVQGAGIRFARFSNGAGARLTEGSYFIINDAFEGGNYKIFIHGRNGNADGVAEAPALYYIPAEGGEPVKIDIEVPTTAGGIMMSVTLENVAIPAGAKLVIKNDGNASDMDLDLISICKQPVAE